MKRLFVLVLFGFGLSACAGASAPGGAKCQQGVCIQAQVTEPVRYNAPVLFSITVTSDRDIPGLAVSIFHDVDAVVDNPPVPEQAIKDTVVSKGGVDWIVDSKANKPFTFTRLIRFPEREGLFTVVVSASTPQLRVADSIAIYIARAGATVYYSGTPVPLRTPGKPLPAVTATPGPSATPAPEMRTRVPTLPLQPFSTPAMPAYP